MRNTAKSEISAESGLDRSLSEIALLLEKVEKEFDISKKKALELLSDKLDSEINVPLSVFESRKLGQLEAITKYLREEHRMRYSEIARLLKKSEPVVGVVYR